jgi:hypothetical protein
MRESRPYGSVRGALSNERPYRDKLTQLAQRRGHFTILRKVAATESSSSLARGLDLSV